VFFGRKIKRAGGATDEAMENRPNKERGFRTPEPYPFAGDWFILVFFQC